MISAIIPTFRTCLAKTSSSKYSSTRRTLTTIRIESSRFMFRVGLSAQTIGKTTRNIRYWNSLLNISVSSLEVSNTSSLSFCV